MFLIGEATSVVFNKRLALPKEFHLQNKVLFAKWKDPTTLIVSDEEGPLNYEAGKLTPLEKVRIDSNSYLEIGINYNRCNAKIKGNVTSIMITFDLKKDSVGEGLV